MDSLATSPAATPPSNVLPPGTRLAEFEVQGLLGVGGFGIVYRAFDHALEREVAIKEYMPAMLAGRTETMHVSLRSQSDAEVFEAGRRSFVNEAKLLARFDHPSLVKVYRFWEANDTAYMAMPIYRGQTLKQTRHAMDGPPPEAWLRALLTPLLAALERLHAEGVFHRDIAPDNILLEPDGRPVLLDFGAARRVIGDRSQNLTAILKPAYAPIEQYAEASAARQGPWTDLYALGATLHFTLLGHAPPPATTRMLHDDLQPLASRTLPGSSPAFLRAIDWMLTPRPGDRPQSVAALRAVLDGSAEVPVAAPALPPTVVWETTQAQTVRQEPTVTLPLEPQDDATVVLRPERTAALPAAETARAPAAASAPATFQPPRSGRWLPLGLGALALAGAAGWWGWGASQRPAPASQPAAGPAASTPMPGWQVLPPAAPASPVAGPAAPAPAATAAPGPAPATATSSRPAPPAAVTMPPATRSAAEGTAGGSRPETEPLAGLPANVPLPKAAELLPPATTGRTPAPAVPLSDDPSAVCGKRVLVAQVVCMERECRTSEWRQHPACLKWRETHPATQP